MLIDRQIREALDSGELKVAPQDGILSRIQPASLDVRLGPTFLTLKRSAIGLLDPKQDTREYWREDVIGDDEEFYVVHPGELVLASTLEQVQLADTLLARVEGKSSLGRLGILVHATAGYVDPGWPMASITLEISTVSGVPTKLYPGMPIAQLAFQQVEPVSTVYAGKYAGQLGPTPSRFHQNWTGSRWI